MTDKRIVNIGKLVFSWLCVEKILSLLSGHKARRKKSEKKLSLDDNEPTTDQPQKTEDNKFFLSIRCLIHINLYVILNNGREALKFLLDLLLNGPCLYAGKCERWNTKGGTGTGTRSILIGIIVQGWIEIRDVGDNDAALSFYHTVNDDNKLIQNASSLFNYIDNR